MDEEDIINRLTEIDGAGAEDSHGVAASMVRQLWEDLDGRKGLINQLDEEVRLEILHAWVRIAAGVSGDVYFRDILDADA